MNIMNSVNSYLSAMIFIIYCTLHYTLCYRSGPSVVHLGHVVPPKTGSSIRIVLPCFSFQHNSGLTPPALQHFLKSFSMIAESLSTQTVFFSPTSLHYSVSWCHLTLLSSTSFFSLFHLCYKPFKSLHFFLALLFPAPLISPLLFSFLLFLSFSPVFSSPSYCLRLPHFSPAVCCFPASPSPAPPAVCGSSSQCWPCPPASNPEDCSSSSSLVREVFRHLHN